MHGIGMWKNGDVMLVMWRIVEGGGNNGVGVLKAGG